METAAVSASPAPATAHGPRSGGVPRPFSAPLRLATSPLRARCDQCGAAASTTRECCLPRPRRRCRTRSCTGRGAPNSAAAHPAARWLLAIYREYSRLGSVSGSSCVVWLEQACSTAGGRHRGWRSTPGFLVHSSKDAIRRRPRGGARPQDPIRAHERRYGPRDHYCGWRCAECSGSGTVAGGGSSSSGCHSSFWRVRLGRDEHRVAVAARGAGAEQLGGAAGAAGRAYLPAWPSSCCGSLSICSSTEAAWTSAEGGR